MGGDDILSVTREHTARAQAEVARASLEVGPLAALSDDQQPQGRPIGCEERERLEQEIEPLLGLQPADGADDDLAWPDATRGPRARDIRRIASEDAMVDPVENGRDPIGPRPVPL